jgi:hypothetical protein
VFEFIDAEKVGGVPQYGLLMVLANEAKNLPDSFSLWPETAVPRAQSFASSQLSRAWSLCGLLRGRLTRPRIAAYGWPVGEDGKA